MTPVERLGKLADCACAHTEYLPSGRSRLVRLTLRLSRRGPPRAGLTLVRFAPEPANERGRVGLSRKFGGGPTLPEIMTLGALIVLYAAAGGGSAAAVAWASCRKRT